MTISVQQPTTRGIALQFGLQCVSRLPTRPACPAPSRAAAQGARRQRRCAAPRWPGARCSWACCPSSSPYIGGGQTAQRGRRTSRPAAARRGSAATRLRGRASAAGGARAVCQPAAAPRCTGCSARVPARRAAATACWPATCFACMCGAAASWPPGLDEAATGSPPSNLSCPATCDAFAKRAERSTEGMPRATQVQGPLPSCCRVPRLQLSARRLARLPLRLGERADWAGCAESGASWRRGLGCGCVQRTVPLGCAEPHNGSAATAGTAARGVAGCRVIRVGHGVGYAGQLPTIQGSCMKGGMRLDAGSWGARRADC